MNSTMPVSTEKRLMKKVIKNALTGCWEFVGSRLPSGYGILWNGNRPEGAHRIAYRLFIEDIPNGLEVDHKCNNRSCVNPDHLCLLSHKDNIRKSASIMGENFRKTHCKRGHPLSGENLFIAKSGSRQCRECMKLHARNAKARKKHALDRQ